MYDFQAEIETTEHFFFCFNLYSLRGSELFDEPEKVYSNFLTLNASVFFVCFVFVILFRKKQFQNFQSKFQNFNQHINDQFQPMRFLFVFAVINKLIFVI